MSGEPRLAPLTILVVFVLSACTSSTSSGVLGSSTPRPSPKASIVFAAVGASESVGIGATEPTRDSWPQVLFRTALPESTVFYNFGIPGARVAQALSDELPEALSVQPTLVTVWLNVNDIIGGVSVQQYQEELGLLVRTLRRGGAARVLLANTPYLDRLPAYLGCRAGDPPAGVDCPPALASTSTAALNTSVSDYNSLIARVAEREGAILVDLHAQGEVPDMHPDWVSSDGFHPSTAGYAAIAGLFASTLQQTTKAGA